MLNSCTIRCRAILFCLLSAVSPALLADADAQEAKKSPNAKLVRAARLVDVKAGKILKIYVYPDDRIKWRSGRSAIRKHAARMRRKYDTG